MENIRTIKKAIELLKQRNQMLEASKHKAMSDHKFDLVKNIEKYIGKNESMILDFKFRISKMKHN
jgi:hypothetical protein